MGPIGALLDRLLIRRQLGDIFDFRRREIARLLGHGKSSAPSPDAGKAISA
jgi:hypothetical protein